MATPTRIAIEHSDGTFRKIGMIVPYGDGGFGALVPYHTANEGYLFNKRGSFWLGPPLQEERYTADDQVKLSFHPDGLVQFSGVRPGKILSGRDHKTGEPKGLGIIASPLSTPITSGPTFSITIWGLSDFPVAEDDAEAIKFRLRDMYYRGCTPATANGVVIEGLLFPALAWSAVRGTGSDFRIHLSFSQFEIGRAMHEVRVISLHNQSTFIGLLASNIQTDLPPDEHFTPPNSGFIMAGPRDNKDVGLYAIYPKPTLINAENAKTLNYRLPT
jgi:hypothetical protein